MPAELTIRSKFKRTLFEYKALRQDGGEVLGRATAEGELELDRLLQRDGLMLVSAKPSRAGQGLEALRMNRHDLVAFTNQLATMIQAGLPLLQSLQHLSEHSRSKAARTVIQAILRLIEGGSNLSEALSAFPGVFPETYIAMVRSGEISGSLPNVLRRQGQFMEWVREIRAITRQALIYPTALSFGIVGLVIILITFLIPALVDLFPGGHEDLPQQTKIVLAISNFIRSHWALMVALAVLGGVGFAVMLRVQQTRIALSRLLLKIPRLGGLINMLCVARFATTAAALQQSGCDIVNTLEMAGDSCGNSFMRVRFHQVLEHVRGGESISNSLKMAGDLDPYLVQLTAVGEASGRLGECFDFIGESYNAEVPRVVKWALGLIEPLVLIFGGVIVAFLLLAALLPIFKIYETLG